jgi:divalent metal cation (Fe/Co/Zn/Cd) transporter
LRQTSLNAWLGWYLLGASKRSHSLILEADGKHVLTDSFTSFGVVAGIGLVMLTGWKPFDSLIAIAVALHILWSGGRPAWRSAVGLLDHSAPQVGKQLCGKLDAICSESDAHYHGVRYRSTGHLRSSKCIDCFRTRPPSEKRTVWLPCSKSACLRS